MRRPASKILLLAAAPLLLASCGGAPQAANGESDIARTAQPLRSLTGDFTTIHSDRTATEAGSTYVYEPVIDGTPSTPWISSAAYAGKHSLAFAVPAETGPHKQRIEYKIAQAHDADGLHFDNARYSGFAFKLEANAAPFLGSALIWQAWQGYPYGPPVSLKIAAGRAPPYRLELCVRNMATGPDSSAPDLAIWSAPIVEPGAWHAVTVYLRPRLDGTSILELWIDGASQVRWTGSIGYDPAAVAGAYDGLDVKNGIYQPTANDGHTIYFDQIRFGASFESVQP